MASENEDRGVQISAGDGIVAHFGDLTAYAVGDTNRLNELLVRLSALAGSSWQETVRTITTGISDAGYDDHPSIACVSIEDHKLAAFVYGSLEVTAKIGGGSTILDGRDSSTWIDVTLRGDIEEVHAGSRTEASLVGLLRDGVVPAGGFLIKTAGPLSSTSTWDPETGAAEDTTAVLPAADSAEDASSTDADTEALATTEELVETEIAKAPAADEPVDTASAIDTSDEDAAIDTSDEDVDRAAIADMAKESTAGMVGMFAKIEQLSRDQTDLDAEPSASAARAPWGINRNDDALDDEDSDFDDFDNFDDLEDDDTSLKVTSLKDTAFDDTAFDDTPFGKNPFSDTDESLTPAEKPYSPFDDHPGPLGEKSKSAEGATATIRKPRPDLRGVHCPSGHFTPLEQTCRTCNVALDSGVTLTAAPRPVLGHLIFDDGAVLNVDRPAVIGSDVPNDYSINDEPTTIVRLDDGHGGVSPVQLEVRASGWSVEIVDMSSSNGTYTMLRDERHTRTRLRSGQAVSLQDGMTVEAGTRTFRFGTGPHGA